MGDRTEKDEEVGGYFCSQPVPKKSKWTDDIWRRLERSLSSTKAGSSTHMVTERQPEKDPEKDSVIVPKEDDPKN